jgi:glycerol-3-phosphate dehydrogenase
MFHFRHNLARIIQQPQRRVTLLSCSSNGGWSAAFVTSGLVMIHCVRQSPYGGNSISTTTTNTAAAAAATSTRSNASQPSLPVPQLKLPSRSEQIQRLQQSAAATPASTTTVTDTSHDYDILVVGGGATGCGVALDATMRGLKTALIERNDFGYETSSRSTKLLWAGIRYLGTATAGLLQWKNLLRPVAAMHDFYSEFRLVYGAHKERKLLLKNNPHLTNWVPIAIPVRNWIAWPPPMGHPLFAMAPLTLPLIMKFYDSLSGFTCPPSHVMTVARSQRKFPQLDDENIKYFQIFYEGQHNDSRTNTCIALTAAEEGATVANYVEMIDVLKDPTTGKAIGVVCRDNLSPNSKPFHVYAKSIVFCGGPFTDELRQMEYQQKSDNSDGMKESFSPAVASSSGTHIVLPGYYSPGGIGMLDINTSDGRFLFFLPWEGSTLVGTTDRKGQPSSYHGPPEEEIEWLLKEVQTYLSDELKVRRCDVLSAWQGFRPLASDPNALPGAPVSRDHVISTNPKTGITFIAGGKWTTYREMAEDVLDRVIAQHGLSPVRPCQTTDRTLRGGIGYHRNIPIRLVQELGVSETSSKHLARTYGMHAYDVCAIDAESDTQSTPQQTWPRLGKTLVEGYPYLECEINYACRYEMACTVVDMLTLRTRLAYLNKEAALIAAPRVADIMAKELRWNRAERNRQLVHAVEIINTFGGSFSANAPSTDSQPEQGQKRGGDVFRLSHEKMGQGSGSRGAGFG